jgi:hypothetical protein
VLTRSRFTTGLAIAAIACLAGCGGTPRTPDLPRPRPAGAQPDTGARPTAPDPDLNRPPPRKLLAIDWSATPLSSEADALAVWDRIAPTGEDWEEKLDEVPAQAARPLAVALLRAGRFTCAGPPPAGDCAPLQLEVPEPGHAAGLADPCLRRLLALWSLAQLEAGDLPRVTDALRAIAAIPPPESQLVAAALRAVPDADQAELLSLIVTAARAGQRDVVDAAAGRLDEAHLIEASRSHVPGALQVLSAEGHRAAYLAAVVDEDMATAARTQAIADLVAADARAAPDGKLGPDLLAALVKAAAARDCAVAAAAARALEQHGERRYVPARPRTRAPEAMMRALCVLASYEPLRDAGEPSLLAGYVPPKGLERVLVEYDALSDVDTDGDGDPHTRRSVDLISRNEVALPEVEDLARAMQRCTGGICRSIDREFRFTFKPINGELWLSRLEIIERPPCP